MYVFHKIDEAHLSLISAPYKNNTDSDMAFTPV